MVQATPYSSGYSVSPDIMSLLNLNKNVKTATPDIIEFDDADLIANAEIIADLLFENIGGQEILSMARYDTVNGQDIAYQPIKNLKIINQEFSPTNLLRLQKTSDRIFANFPIKLLTKVPNEGNGPDGTNVYRNTDGSIVLEFVNLAEDEQIEIQIATSGTIYEAGI
jgi:hypothetical protein